MGNAVIGTGRYLPERVVTNQEIQDSGVDYDPARCGGLSLAQWGHKYLGGTLRHWVAPGQGIADIAAIADRPSCPDPSSAPLLLWYGLTFRASLLNIAGRARRAPPVRGKGPSPTYIRCRIRFTLLSARTADTGRIRKERACLPELSLHVRASINSSSRRMSCTVRTAIATPPLRRGSPRITRR